MKKQESEWKKLVCRTAEYIRKNHLIAGGDSVCVGFSGGADSTFLLRALYEMKENSRLPDFRLSALHVNHELRGEESMQDQAFAEETCRKLGLELYLYSYPVRKLAASDGLSLEEEGRRVRQEAYRDCMAKRGVTSIALAHHANDQAETLLFRMARGSSITGMGGIRPRNGFLIHPLLGAEKRQIEAAMAEQGYGWRTDSSNLSTEFARNALRHDVIPYLEEHLNKAAVRHIADLAEDMALADEFLMEAVQEKSKIYLTADEESGAVLVSGRLGREAEILQRCLILQALTLASGKRKDLGRTEIFRINDLLEGPCGREADLPYGLTAVRRQDGVLIVPGRKKSWTADSRAEKESRSSDRNAGSEEQKDKISITEEMLEKGSREVFFQGAVYRFTLLPAGSVDPNRIPRKDFTKWLDYDKMSPNFYLRHRMPGDFLQVRADGGRQKLKQLLIDRKVPREDRDRLVVLASGGSIFWAVGLRISESCRITEETSRILRVERIVTKQEA